MVLTVKIGIYHPFGHFPDNYSLCHVVQEQILMIIENGHECYFYCKKQFKWDMPELFTTHPNIEKLLTVKRNIKQP